MKWDKKLDLWKWAGIMWTGITSKLQFSHWFCRRFKYSEYDDVWLRSSLYSEGIWLSSSGSSRHRRLPVWEDRVYYTHTEHPCYLLSWTPPVSSSRCLLAHQSNSKLPWWTLHSDITTQATLFSTSHSTHYNLVTALFRATLFSFKSIILFVIINFSMILLLH
jgi:hypothetical protein